MASPNGLVAVGSVCSAGFDDIAERHFAATPDTAVWIGIPTVTADPEA